MADTAARPGTQVATGVGGACQAPRPSDKPVRVADALLCGRAATRLVLIACVHHDGAFRVCEPCYADLAGEEALCCACWEIDGHSCVLLVTDLTELEKA